jgi:endonuclease/exonuclease/phosphatase family metal-dependent hydrolase
MTKVRFKSIFLFKQITAQMKNLSWFNKIMFVLNIGLTIITFVAYILPFLAPKLFPLLSVFTLFMPFLLFLNLLFFTFWAFQFRKRLIISGLVLLMGITFINKFYKFSYPEYADNEKDFTVMSYNVRLFNLFDWIERDNVNDQILTFINIKNPDILCIQEYSTTAKIDLKVYQHKYIFMQGEKIKTGQAIFSKFPIINQGNIDFPNSNNTVIFADIKKGKDLIRVYNIHLESIKISPDVSEISKDINSVNQEQSQKVFYRISEAFKKQQQQAEMIKTHKENCNLPIIICGDMNNSAFSYVYRNIKGTLNDAFEEAGKGFGATYRFKYFPARIDYIFADDNIQVKKFESFDGFQNSDHFPIMAKLFVE